jgi:hypothetical protein
MKFEFVPLVVNMCGFVYYLIRFTEPGKILYWLGAVILTLGLLKMKG